MDLLELIERKFKTHVLNTPGQQPNLLLLPYADVSEFLREAEKRAGYPFPPAMEDTTWHGMKVRPADITEVIVAYRCT